MNQYNNEKRFVLFHNRRKSKDTQPDMKGEITIDGVAYCMSAWIKPDRNGNNFLSGSIELPRTQQANQPVSQPETQEDPF